MAAICTSHFTTSTLPRGERLDRWRDELSRRLTVAECSLADPRYRAFAARYVVVEGATLALGRARLVNARQTRTPQCLSDGDDRLTLFVLVSGRALVEQGDVRVLLHPGDAVLVRHDAPVDTRWPCASLLSVRVPGAILARELGLRHDLNTRFIKATSPYARLLGACAVAAHGEATNYGYLAPLTERILIELLVGALLANEPCVGVHALRVVAAKSIIRRRYPEADLTARQIAVELGVSVRTLYAALAEEGLQFSNELRAVRLRAANERLALAGPSLRILDVALDVGFSDLSHFNHVFRQRFGRTPSEARRDN